MNKKRFIHKNYLTTLLFCFLQIVGFDGYAQTPARNTAQDSIVQTRQAPQARARRNRNDTILRQTERQINIITNSDSVFTSKVTEQLTNPHDTLIVDSLNAVNKSNLEKMEAATSPTPPPVFPKDSLTSEIPKKIWIPNSTKSTWLAIVFPGGGQIYNRKYWKLPIIYGGFAGCAYALTWNGKMYKDYSQGYRDIMDSNPNTNSYKDLLPPNYNVSDSQLKNLLRKRKDTFRRYRDLSIFAFIGVYIISVIDAYVDAELSDFDISPDLSMRIEPTLMNDQHHNGNKSVGVQCSFRF